MNEQQFDEEKLLKRAKERLSEEIKSCGGRGFIKKWGTEDAFLKWAVKNEKHKAKKLIKQAQSKSTITTKKKPKNKPKSVEQIRQEAVRRDKKIMQERKKRAKGVRKGTGHKVLAASRSAEAKRWRGWRETDGKRHKVIVYKNEQ